MQAKCPYCAEIFDTAQGGVQPCPRCGRQVNVPVPVEPTATGPLPPQRPLGAACAVHADRPAAGTCERCGNFMCEECNLGGATKLCPSCRELAGAVARAPTPWERRAELGFLQGLWQTWKDTLLTPEKFWATLMPNRSIGDPFLYAWLLTALGAALQFLINLLNFGSAQQQIQQALERGQELPPEVQRIIEALLGNPALLASIALGTTVVLFPLGWLLGAAFIHLGALVFGAGKNGFAATARVYGYATAPTVLAWIPCIGAMAGIYSLVLAVWGLKHAQETTVGRAIGAVLFFPLVLACLCCGLALAAAGLGAAGR